MIENINAREARERLEKPLSLRNVAQIFSKEQISLEGSCRNIKNIFDSIFRSIWVYPFNVDRVE